MSDFDVSSFVASFFDEAKERLALIDQHLVALEAGELDEEGLNRLRRDAHTIKGSALMLGVTDVGDMAHLFEDAIESLIRHPEFRTAEMVQFLYDVHDQLADRLARPDAETPLDPERFRIRFDSLREYMEVESPSVHATMLADEGGSPPVTGEVPGTEGRAAIPVDAEGLGGFRPDLSRLQMLMPEARQGSGRFMRVDAERLDALSNQVMALTLAKSRFSSMVEGFGELAEGLRDLRQRWWQVRQSPQDPTSSGLEAMDEAFAQFQRRVRRFGNEMRYEQDRSSIVLNDIRDQILGLMLRPLDSIFSTFPRAVRDAAMREHKHVRLQLAGQSVEMDQGAAEALVEPLIHLLNNAIAHGIESPEERRQAGKPEEGMISILAEQSGNEVHIDVIDDGRGIDIARLREEAIRRGVVTPEEGAQMDSAEVLEMIFRPGFTTHEDVDAMAGRGMGMNAVQETLRRLTGTVRIHTERGRGTCFSLSVPVSITVQRSLQFRIGDHRFGMLTHLIAQVLPLASLPLPGDDEARDAAVRQVVHEGQMLPLVDLRHVLQGRAGTRVPEPHVIIAKHIEGHVGVVVDALLEESEIIVRDIDPYLKRYQLPGVMGTSIVGDGQVLLLIEPYGIKEMGRTAPAMTVQAQYLGEPGREETPGEESPRVLLVEDSLIAREVERRMLLQAGFSVETAIDGVDALEKLRARPYRLIVTDLEMPRLDGFGLLRQLQGEPGLAGIPVLVISTRDSAEDRQCALDAGANAYLIKPELSREALAETLHGLLHR